ncbi:Bet1-like SNARE 1-1, partial [Glycine soja]
RDNRNNRVSLFDGIEEGGIRASSVYSSSHEIDEHDNEQALDGLQDRVNLLKRVSLLLLSTYPRPHLVLCIYKNE